MKKSLIYSFFFLLSFSLKAQLNISKIEDQEDFEFESMEIKGFHEWERTMFKVLSSTISLNPISQENSFIKALKVKTVRKYLTVIGRDSIEKKRFVYEIKYDRFGNLTSEKNPYYLKIYLYNNKGFLTGTQVKKNDSPSLYSIGSVVHYKEKKIWSQEFPYSKLKKQIFLDSEDRVSAYKKYSYLKNILIHKITHYGSNDKCSLFYSFEYEFHQ
jgi:hypothetical protein